MRLKCPTIALICSSAALAAPVLVTPTTSSPAFTAALGGGGILTITSAAVQNGAASQFGTYTGYNGGPVTIGDGIVMSTGQVAQVTPGFNNGQQGSSTTPSTDLGSGANAAFTSYALGRVANFSSGNDVAVLQIAFTLSTASQIGFDFLFGSVEYPQFTSVYTDAFFAFLDGTGASNQIVFDASNNPVQVGTTFAGALSTGDTNTAFGSPHGVLRLTTFTSGQLAAGAHTLTFMIGDVNDGILDSAVFISNLRATAGSGRHKSHRSGAKHNGPGRRGSAGVWHRPLASRHLAPASSP